MSAVCLQLFECRKCEAGCSDYKFKIAAVLLTDCNPPVMACTGNFKDWELCTDVYTFTKVISCMCWLVLLFCSDTNSSLH